MLSEVVMQTLIDACQDQDKNVRSVATRALSMHIDLIYSMLPDLSLSQLESLYTGVLFEYSCKHIALFYAQNHQLHFYTKMGAGKTARIDEEKIQKVIQAFEGGQIKEGMKSIPNEELWLREV